MDQDAAAAAREAWEQDPSFETLWALVDIFAEAADLDAARLEETPGRRTDSWESEPNATGGMLVACYRHAMSTLQVKNLPEELHAALAARAKSEGVTMSEFVTRTLHKELSRPTMAEWVERRRAHAGPLRDIDTLAALDAAREEYDPDERFPPR